MAGAPKYPEHEKLQKIQESSQTISEFMDWLTSQGIVLCKWREAGTNGKPRTIPVTEADLAKIRKRVGYQRSWEELQAHQYGVDNPKFESWESGYIPVNRTIPGLLADYFQIDQTKVLAEKQKLLDEILRLNAAIQELKPRDRTAS
jgi:hypothetical protein